MTTSQPAFASSIAANDPPAPLPITMALVMGLKRAEELEDVGHDAGVACAGVACAGVACAGVACADRIVAVGPLHLVGGVAARLGVAGEADLLPAGQVLVAPVLGAGVHALDGVLEQQAPELADRLRGQDLVLSGVAHCGEVAAGQLVELADSRGV